MHNIEIKLVGIYGVVAVVIFFGLCFISFADQIQSQSPSIDITKESFSEAFTSKAYSAKEKWDLASRETVLSTAQHQELCSLLSDTDNGDAWYYALTALVAANDVSSAGVISQLLLNNENRYYALALGLLGDKKAVPVLKQVLEQTQREHVKQGVLSAFRMLGVSSEEDIPAETVGGYISIHLSATHTNISIDEPFVLRVALKNNVKENAQIKSRDLLFSQYLAVFSAEGHYVFPIRQLFSMRSDSNSLIEISPGEEVVIEERCSVQIEDSVAGNWPVKTQKIFVLHGNSGTWAFDVAPYVPEKDLGIKLVFMCDASDFSEDDKLSRSRIISNCLLLNVKGLHEGP